MSRRSRPPSGRSRNEPRSSMSGATKDRRGTAASRSPSVCRTMSILAGAPGVLAPTEVRNRHAGVGEVDGAIDGCLAARGDGDPHAAIERPIEQVAVQLGDLGEALAQPAERNIVGDELNPCSGVGAPLERVRHVEVPIDVGDGKPPGRAHAGGIDVEVNLGVANVDSLGDIGDAGVDEIDRRSDVHLLDLQSREQRKAEPQSRRQVAGGLPGRQAELLRIGEPRVRDQVHGAAHRSGQRQINVDRRKIPVEIGEEHGAATDGQSRRLPAADLDRHCLQVDLGGAAGVADRRHRGKIVNGEPLDAEVGVHGGHLRPSIAGGERQRSRGRAARCRRADAECTNDTRRVPH